MTCAIIGDRVIRFAYGLHSGDCIGNGGIDPRVVSGVKAVHVSLDSRHGFLLWRSAVKDKRRGQISAIRGEAERLAAAPAKAANKQLFARSWQLEGVVS